MPERTCLSPKRSLDQIQKIKYYLLIWKIQRLLVCVYEHILLPYKMQLAYYTNLQFQQL